MKKTIYLLLLFCFLSCAETKAPKVEEAMDKIENFDWLVGSWKRTNEEAPKHTYETWSKKSNIEYIGLAFTMVEKEVVWKEDVVLRKVNNQWNFEVTGKGETKASIFVLTDISADSFVCKNDQNEFPKKIQYFKKGQKINAMISGGGPEISFEFVRV